MRFRPVKNGSLLLAGQVYADLGRADKASAARRRGVDVAESSLLLDPENTRALYLGANGLVALGETDTGLKWAQQALLRAPEDPMVLYNAGCIFALAGLLRVARLGHRADLLDGVPLRHGVNPDRPAVGCAAAAPPGSA